MAVSGFRASNWQQNRKIDQIIEPLTGSWIWLGTGQLWEARMCYQKLGSVVSPLQPPPSASGQGLKEHMNSSESKEEDEHLLERSSMSHQGLKESTLCSCCSTSDWGSFLG